MKNRRGTTPIRELNIDEFRFVSGAGRDACYYSYDSGSGAKFSSNSNNFKDEVGAFREPTKHPGK